MAQLDANTPFKINAYFIENNNTERGIFEITMSKKRYLWNKIDER